MKKYSIIGIDLAKNSIQVHGVDEHGKTTLRRRISRAKAMQFFANIPTCLIGLEACSGSHYWARELRKLGHEVRQMPPQYVKPYVKTNKNDRNDAEAICEAAGRPNMRFVATKSVEQQDLQALHRIRERLVRSRTAVANQTRGLLAESGIVVAQGIRHVRRELPVLVEDLDNRLSMPARDYLSDLYEELVTLDEKIAKYDGLLCEAAERSELCRRVMDIPGFGPLGATALVAAVGDAKGFANGRQLAAWAGLTPRQHSTGGKDRLLGISKRGNTYLRTLLIHGGRAVLRHCGAKSDGRSVWLRELAERRGNARAAVAMANKMLRMAWAVLARGEAYRAMA